VPASHDDGTAPTPPRGSAVLSKIALAGVLMATAETILELHRLISDFAKEWLHRARAQIAEEMMKSERRNPPSPSSKSVKDALPWAECFR